MPLCLDSPPGGAVVPPGRTYQLSDFVTRRDSGDRARDPVDLTLLRSFLEVVDARSVTEAARRLGLTQPAVSKQLGALERRYGNRLFHRDGRGVRPTRAGLVLAERARSIVRRLEDLETGRIATPERPVVRLGLSPTLADPAVVPLLRATPVTLPGVPPVIGQPVRCLRKLFLMRTRSPVSSSTSTPRTSTRWPEVVVPTKVHSERARPSIRVARPLVHCPSG